MELRCLKATNFLSFKDVVYEFQNGVPVLIQGVNLTDNGQESNGSGKSVLIAIIEFCILHTTSKKCNDAKLISWWAEDSEQSLSIYCPIRKETMLIERGISLKKGGRSQLSFNDVVKYSFDDKASDEIDKEIIQWIGISREDLQNFYLISKFKYVSFFSASNAVITALIGRFSNADILAGIDKDILQDGEAINTQRTTLSEQRNQLLGALQVYKDLLLVEQTADRTELVQKEIDRIDDLILQHGDSIDQIFNIDIHKNNQLIAQCDIDIDHLQLSIDKANKDIQTLISQNNFGHRYAEIEESNATVLKQKQQIQQSRTKTDQQYTEITALIREITLNLTGTTTCPKCAFEFVVGNADIDVAAEKQAQIESQTILEQIDASVRAFNVQIQELNDIIVNNDKLRMNLDIDEKAWRKSKSDLELLSQRFTTDQQRLNFNRNSYVASNDQLRTRVQQLEQTVSDLLTAKADVTPEMFNNTEKIIQLQEQIDEQNDQIAVLDAQDKELQEQLIVLKEWAYCFKEFQQHLSVKTLKVLQGYTNKFLSDIGSDMRVQLEGFKIKSNGELSDKITTYIIRDGEMREFGNFSGGERVRLEAAMILTIQHAINSTHKFGGLNFLSIDEVFESADSLGISTLTSSFMGLNRTILITTHIPVANYECDVLKIVKRDRISYIEN